MKLDLHGVKHEDVQREVDKFIWEAMEKDVSQIEIVTGNSDPMKMVVTKCVKDYGLICNEGLMNNGYLLIDLY